jgi:hypothetical protein
MGPSPKSPGLPAPFFFSLLSYLGINNSLPMGLMEDDVKDFFKRIVWSVSLGFLWLTLTLGIGAYNQLMVQDPTLTIGNIIFYIWTAGTLAALIYINVRIWKKKFPHG